MRFTAIIFAAALAGMVASAPTPYGPSAVEQAGNAIQSFDDASGITDLENAINNASDGALDDVEGQLGITYAEKQLGIEKRQTGDLQTIGAGLKEIEDGTGITAAEGFLNAESGGAYDAFENATGITDLDNAIGAERK